MSTPKAPVARGTKDPALLEQVREPVAPGGGHVYLVNRRPMSYQGHMLPVGVEVPDAGTWSRLEAWLTAKRVRLAGRDEEFMSFEEFVASLEEPTPVKE